MAASEEQVTLQVDGEKPPPVADNKKSPTEEQQPLNGANGVTPTGHDDKVANGNADITEDAEVVTPGGGKRKPVWYKRKCMIVGLALFLLIIFGAIIGLVIHRFTGSDDDHLSPESKSELDQLERDRLLFEQEERLRQLNKMRGQSGSHESTDKVGDSDNAQPRNRDFDFASYYQSHMVLQRAPQRAHIWGFATSQDVGKEVTLTIDGGGMQKQYTGQIIAKDPKPVWSILLDPLDDKGPYTLTARIEDKVASIYDVLMGDVWLCSGQSNILYELNQSVRNASDEMNDASSYPDIRIFAVGKDSDSTPQTDLRNIALSWSTPTRDTLDGPGKEEYFSGLCYLYGKRLHRELGYPIGLISSAVSATHIELWVPQEILQACPEAHTVKYFGAPPTGHWNAMVHPLTPLSIYGILWYQGESNALSLARQYNCTFPGLVRSWRGYFHEGRAALTGQPDSTTIKPKLPFGFVQLSSNREGHLFSFTFGFPDIRWQQTADFGFVPNAELTETFMAVAVDLPDPESPDTPIHPRNKHEISQRLFLGAMGIAYPGMRETSFRYQGPIPSKYRAMTNGQTLRIIFDIDQLEVRNKTGFEVCCKNTTEPCPSSNTANWVAAPIVNNSPNSITLSWSKCGGNKKLLAIRYLWRETPCPYKKCAIYDSSTDLPAPPYIYYKMRTDTKRDQRFERRETVLL